VDISATSWRHYRHPPGGHPRAGRHRSAWPRPPPGALKPGGSSPAPGTYAS